MPCCRRKARKSPNPHPTSSSRRRCIPPASRSAAKRLSCEERVRKPSPRWSKPKRRTLSSYQREVSLSRSKELIAVEELLPREVASERPAIEEQVQSHQPGNERPRATLRMGGMAELLP